MKRIQALIVILLSSVFICGPVFAQEKVSEELEEYIDGYFNFYYRAHYKPAADLAEEAVIYIEKKSGTNHANAAASLNNLAALHRYTGEFDKAQKEYLRAKEIYELNFGPRNLYAAKVTNSLGELYFGRGQYKEAEKSFVEAEFNLNAILGASHPDLARVVTNLGLVYEKQRKFNEAESFYRRALSLLGGGHPNAIRVLASLGQLYHGQKKDNEAEAAWRQAWDIFKWVFKREKPGAEDALNRLDSERKDLWRQSHVPIYQRLTDINDMYISPFHPDAVKFLNLLPRLYLSQKRFGEADLLYDSELELMMSNLGQEHYFVADLLESIARFYKASGQKEKAINYRQRAEGVRSKAARAE